MSRRKSFRKRVIKEDRIYHSFILSKFINYLMKDGKKNVAEKILYKTMDIISNNQSSNPLEIFQNALNNIRPQFEVKSRRIGGSNYQIPIDIKHDRSLCLSMKWLIYYSKKRQDINMSNKLAKEINDANSDKKSLNYNKCGSIKKKQLVHKLAEANKAFSHYKL